MNVINLYEQYVLKTYTRTPLVITKGKGIKVWDENGVEYLDFFPGWAVSGIGHCHPRVVKALQKQAGELIHVSNNFYSQNQAKLAEVIIKNSYPGKVFFANSGAEAVEGGIKLARKYGNPDRNEIISFKGSFHGRTLAAITATAQPKYSEPFKPLPGGFKYAEFSDIESVKSLISDKTCGIIIELIQGEGGINVATQEFVEYLRKITLEKDIVLIFDEVQTGMGRTGELFCYKNYGVTPDVMLLSKALGGGVPISAIVVAEKFKDILVPGTHAATFGGSPIVCAASLATFEAIEKENLLKNAIEMGEYLRGKLEELKTKYPVIKEVRGKALMLGVELNTEGVEIINACFEKKLLINCTQGKVLRIMPPLTVTKKDIDKAVSIIDEVLAK